MIILGISAFFHDSAAAILVDGKIVAACQEERLSRKKHDNSFPILACEYCLKEAAIDISMVDHVVFYEKPFLKFERLLETAIYDAPYSYQRFLKAMPVWLGGRLNMERLIRKELKKQFNYKVPSIKFTEHHLSHAAISYFTSRYDDAAILVLDAVGEWATTSILYARNGIIQTIKEQHYPHSIGLLYSAFTYFLGFKVNSDEYKVMGLAPYGSVESAIVQRYIKIIKDEIVSICEDGAIILNMDHFSFHVKDRMIEEKKWEKLFGVKRRNKNEAIEQIHCDIACAIQFVTQEIGLRLAKEAKKLTNSKNLCISGGVALNCSMNGAIYEEKIFENIYVPVDPGDSGGAIGAALAFSMLNGEHVLHNNSAYLGPSYTNEEVLTAIKEASLRYEYKSTNDLYDIVSSEIEAGKIIGWFQGRLEFGPRALGNRSILGDPRLSDMKFRLNASIKFREAFRPFAPSILQEYVLEVFNQSIYSPYMMFITHIKENGRMEHKEKDLNSRISEVMSAYPAITHYDYSARPQTVMEEDNPIYYGLLKCFKDRTNCPLLVNTSFNVMGEPIVCSPTDAINTFLNSGIDVLVMNNYIIRKSYDK